MARIHGILERAQIERMLTYPSGSDLLQDRIVVNGSDNVLVVSGTGGTQNEIYIPIRGKSVLESTGIGSCGEVGQLNKGHTLDAFSFFGNDSDVIGAYNLSSVNNALSSSKNTLSVFGSGVALSLGSGILGVASTSFCPTTASDYLIKTSASGIGSGDVSLSMGCFFKYGETSRDGCLVSIGSGTVGSGEVSRIWVGSDGIVQFDVGTASSPVVSGSLSVAWHHAALSYNSATGVCKCYIDGATVGSFATTWACSTVPSIVIGADPAGTIEAYGSTVYIDEAFFTKIPATERMIRAIAGSRISVESFSSAATLNADKLTYRVGIEDGQGCTYQLDTSSVIAAMYGNFLFLNPTNIPGLNYDDSIEIKIV